MFFYQLRLAGLSLRRHPAITLLSIGAIALGIAVAGTFVTFYHVYTTDPIPEKSSDLFYVRLDNWSPDSAFDTDYPERPPYQVTWRDAAALLDSDIPLRQSPMFRALLFIGTEGSDEAPRRSVARLATRDFFPMFNVPFRYGGPWDEEADRLGELVVVLGSAMNDRLFGGEDSMGRRVEIDHRFYTVVGVVDEWRPAIKFYDMFSGLRARPEQIYLPFLLSRDHELRSTGSRSSWKSFDGGWDALRMSDTIWLQMWVELDSPEKVGEYQAYLDAYTEDQRRFGRFERPTNNWIQPLIDWVEEFDDERQSSISLVWIGLLFLMICAVNLIGLLLGKFFTHAPEVGVRRALGASRRSIFMQYLVECEVVSLLGGGLGVVLLHGILLVANRLPGVDLEAMQMNTTLYLTSLGLALLAGLVAGIWPAWRVCAVPPALHLKVS